MSRPNKQKIPTEAPSGGLFAAFAGLEIQVPATSGPEAPPAGTAEKPSKAPKNPGRVVLRRETAHRGGKCVVVLDGFDPALDDEFLHALAKRLRAACGCGGAVKGRAIELQGEQAARARQLLAGEGFRVAGV